MATTTTIFCADATRLPLADLSVDVTIGSPPYADARLYLENGVDLGISRKCNEWVEWMLEVTMEALRVTRGPVIWIAAGVTRDRNYWPACEGLMWEWWKRGGHAYRPCFWRRVGIPGSGGDQWFRADVEYCMCFKRPGKLPWSDNTAMGHPPKWGPGGEMSYRLSNGQRVNQWGLQSNQGRGRRANGKPKKGGSSPSHVVSVWGRGGAMPETRNGDVHRVEKPLGTGENLKGACRQTPVLANPGNLIRTNTGGGALGAKEAHENEAPFPEKLAEWFIRSVCPPGGTVLDPFSGSGTTAAVAKRTGRNAIACDLRMSQCELTRRRLRGVQPELAFD